MAVWLKRGTSAEAKADADSAGLRAAEIRLAGEPTRRLSNMLHALASLPIELVAA